MVTLMMIVMMLWLLFTMVMLLLVLIRCRDGSAEPLLILGCEWREAGR